MGDWKDLYDAAGEGNSDTIRLHLRNRVDPDFQHPEYFSLPIFAAIRGRQLAAVQVLVEEGRCDIEAAEEISDQSPIEVALEVKAFEIADYLNSRMQRSQFRTIVITGGNRGIGRDTARRLLEQGHTVFVTVRKNGEETVEYLRRMTGNPKISWLSGDLSSIASTKALVRTIRTHVSNLDVLISNAGVWPTSKELNEDGLELGFMVNYMAPYILCRDLLDVLKPSSRIVLVSGGIYVKGKADVAKTPWGLDFHPIFTYASTKQCTVFLLLEMHKLLRESSSTVTINAVHPGVFRTSLGDRNGCLGIVLRFVKQFWRPESESGEAPAMLATDDVTAGVSGKYYIEKEESAIADCVLSEEEQVQWSIWTKDFLAKHGA